MNTTQENLKKMFDVEAVNQTLNQFADQESVKAVKDAFEQNTQLASKLIATNTSAASEVVNLQTAEVRKGVEGFLKQVDVLVNTKDMEAAVEAQRAYAEQATEALTQLTRKNVDIITDAVQSSVNLVRESTAKPAAKKAPVKAAAKKAPVKKAAPKTA